MKQKEVKIIGLKIQQSLGILQACEMKFSQENKLIAIHGEVGSGKTTLTKALQLGTQGSKTLKDDKKLYGAINEEIQLLDGELPVFIGCKSDKGGNLGYSIYIRDAAGKIQREPIIDGAKATPAEYLKALQTALTWRMNELTSDNPSVQKKILLDLYKKELAKVGVVYDKKSLNYENSILDRIEKAENDRVSKDVLRKQVGGFANHLKDNGYDVEKPDSLPTKPDLAPLKKEKADIEFSMRQAKENGEQVRDKNLTTIKNDAIRITGEIHELNAEYQKENETIREKNKEVKEHNLSINDLKSNFDNLFQEADEIMPNCFDEISQNVQAKLAANIEKETGEIECALIPFKESVCDTTPNDDYTEEQNKLISKLDKIRAYYIAEKNKPLGEIDNSDLEAKLEQVEKLISEANDIMAVCESIDAFYEWQEADRAVQKLKDEYSKLLAQIDTGVEGLQIKVEDENIFLYYNGAYDKQYFNNPKMEFRKLSSYSSTQRPLVCLLIQNHLLSLKTKAMRYLWIDDVPIDNKTKKLLEKMCSELNLTLFVNITGDFTEDALKDGEMLIVGGEIFFNNGDGVKPAKKVEDKPKAKEAPVVEEKKPVINNNNDILDF